MVTKYFVAQFQFKLREIREPTTLKHHISSDVHELWPKFYLSTPNDNGTIVIRKKLRDIWELTMSYYGQNLVSWLLFLESVRFEENT